MNTAFSFMTHLNNPNGNFTAQLWYACLVKMFANTELTYVRGESRSACRVGKSAAMEMPSVVRRGQTRCHGRILPHNLAVNVFFLKI